MSPWFGRVRYLLLQSRKAADPMRSQEVRCFARTLLCDSIEQIQTHDLIGSPPSPGQLAKADIVLLGGSGDFSVAEGGPWIAAALEAMQTLYETSKPTFASCWGFQAMAKALGGEVETDLARAELGTLPVRLTHAGLHDPVFGPLGETFDAPMGHQDHVTRLPSNATLLAYTPCAPHQAFCFPEKPIYCTQFHPELNRQAILERVRAYPQYVERIAGMSIDEFCQLCHDTPHCEEILPRFVRQVLAFS